MRRLEYTRKCRTSSAAAKNPNEAVMMLAHVARERSRLEQERATLEKRIRRIQVRLGEIAGTETRLVPFIRSGLDRVAAHAALAARPGVAPVSSATADVTLRY